MKNKFYNIRALNEQFATYITDYRKSFADDIKAMEESYFYMRETEEIAFQIITITYKKVVYDAENITNRINERSMISKKIAPYIKDPMPSSNQQSKPAKIPTITEEQSEKSSNQQSNCLKPATIPPNNIEEQSEKSGINDDDANDDSDDDANGDSDGDEQSESKSRMNDEQSIESAIEVHNNNVEVHESALEVHNNNQSLFLQNSEDENNSTIIKRPNNSVHNLGEELSSSFDDQISLRDQHVVEDTYNIMLDAFHSQFQGMVFHTIQKNQHQHRLAAKLVRTFAVLNKTLAIVIPDLECKASIARLSIESTESKKSTKRRIRTYCRQELFEILSLMISFCKAIFEQKRDLLLEYLDTDDDIDSVLERSSTYSHFVLREDELLVSFYTDALYSKRLSLYDLVITNSDSFLTKPSTLDILTKQKYSSAVLHKAKYISTAVIELLLH